MKFQKTPISIAAFALFAAAPLGAQAAPTVSFSAPAAGATISQTINQSSQCAVTGQRIQRVVFSIRRSGTSSWTTLNTEQTSPWQCNIDPSRFAAGQYTLRAVAYDQNSGGASATATRTINLGAANTPPSVSITSPAAGATLTAAVSGSACAASASDQDGTVSRVDFVLNNGSTGTPVGSRTAAPYQCAIDTANFANGSYTLMATATDNAGATSSTQRSLTINKPVSNPAPSPIAPADILTRASADTPFAQQSGYTAQVINTYTSASQIPESGIHGSALPNGETLRLGKTVDPTNSVLNALSFQVRNSDPTTSSGKRAELSISPNIDMDKVYWIAFSAYVYDWGTLPTGDDALFGVQMHTGDNDAGVGGPSFGIYTQQNGRSLRVHARYNLTTNPRGSGDTVKVTYPTYPIPFHRWTDFVVKFKHNLNGNGFLQVWMDGEIIANHQGNLGYNTGRRDYAKFGYYAWGTNMASNQRKVLLRAPTIVADPTGQTYTHEQLRTLVGASAAATASTSTSTSTPTSTSTSSTGTTTTASSGDGGVCSTITCAAQ